MSDTSHTRREKAPEITSPEDLALFKERDNHERDMEYRKTQILIARIVILGCAFVGATAFFLGIYLGNDVVTQAGSALMFTILGMALSFVFPKP